MNRRQTNFEYGSATPRVHVAHATIHILIIFATVLALTICSGGISRQACAAQGSGATMFQANPQHTGVFDVQPITHMRGVQFSFRTNGPVRGTPALHDGRIYFGSGDGTFYAVDQKSGKQIWHHATGGVIYSSAAVADGRVCFTSRDGYLYMLETGDGKEIWKFKTGADLPYQNGYDNYLSSPVIVGDIVYVGGGDGFLYAIDVASGSVKWKYNASSRVRTSPAVTNDMVLCGTLSGHLIAVKKETGTELWKFAIEGATMKFADYGYDRSGIVSSPTVADGQVFVGGRDGFLYAVDLKTGKQRWRYDHQISWVISTPAVANGAVYAGSSDGRFFQSVDAQKGTENWRFDTRGNVWGSAALAGNMMYFGDYEGVLYAIDRTTGAERWHFLTGDRIFGAPALADGALYVGSDDGYLYALNGSSSPETTAVRPRRVVFWEKAPGFTYFSNSVAEGIRDYFKNDGYAVVDAAKLEEFMKLQLTQDTPSVVVFADHRIPKNVAGDETENCLLRKYLDAGGKVVWLGTSPLAYVRDTAGLVSGINFKSSERILGIRYPGRSIDMLGLYSSSVTPAGEHWGLRGWWVGFGSVDAGQATTVLAKDENGMAGCWVKNYGGKEGTGLVQLFIPRNRLVDLGPVRAAAEYGLE